MRSNFLSCACMLVGCGIAGVAWPYAAPVRLADLVDLDLEQLSRVTVTSAARREQTLLEAPASLFVITAEDIRRSGASSLAEALRLAPNLQVVRTDTSQYVVSARGGLTTTANKMLVLIDGRTVYTPLFSGVFYDAFAPVLEDIERIEVISGPGGTLWGTNAVNGVINVTTRASKSTLGTMVAAGAGDRGSGISVRHGWSGGADTAMRVYMRYFDRDDHVLQAGGSAKDDAQRWQAGLRADLQRGGTTATWQAEVYRADVNNLSGARDLSGGNVLGRWRADLTPDSTATFQAYYDRTERVHAGTFDEERDTLDFEAQNTHRLGEGNVLSWGGGYRVSRDRTVPTAALRFTPASRTLQFTSVFAQDEFRLARNLLATAGLRLERNSYTGWEWLPNLRLSYAVSPQHVAWGALSRAVRSPSRLDVDLVIPGQPPFLVNNPDFESELADVAEVGYRGAFGTVASLSVTGFHHRFRRLRTGEPAGASLTLANGAEGRIQGLEAWGDFRPTPHWRLVWGVTRMRHSVELLPGRVNLIESPLGNNPRRTASLRSLWNLGESLQLDLFLRHVGQLPNPAIPSYTQLGARLGWRVSRKLELSLVGNNLLDKHVEFGAAATRVVFEPSVFAKATWSF